MQLIQGSTTVAQNKATEAKEVYQRAGSKPMPSYVSPVAKGLTSTEHYIYNDLTHGLSIREIATKQNIAEKTVKFHSTRIYKKLGVKSVKGLMALEIGYYRGAL